MLTERQKRFIRFKKFEPKFIFALFLFMLLGTIITHIGISARMKPLETSLKKMEIAAQKMPVKTDSEIQLKAIIIGDVETYREILLSTQTLLKSVVFMMGVVCVMLFIAHLNSKKTVSIIEQLEK